MIHLTRTTVGGACMAAVLAMGPTASAASWQRSYLEPAIQAWMGVVTLLADDGERDEDDRDSKCEGNCDKDDCDECRGKHARKDHKERHHGKRMHGDGPHDGQMGPPHGPRGDAISLLHDIHARLGRIERMLASRGPGGPPMAGPHHGGHPGRRDAMEGPKGEMYQRMSAAREKWENASPEEQAEMKEKMKARMEEGRDRMEEVRRKWENASPEERAEMKEKMKARMQEARDRMPQRKLDTDTDRGDLPEDARSMVAAARKRAAELDNRVKRLEAELERLKEALKSRD